MRHVLVAAVLVTACRDKARQEREPAPPVPPAPTSCETFGVEVADALATVLRDLQREAPRARIDEFVKRGLVTTCTTAMDTKWASAERKAAVTACLVERGPALARASRCFPEAMSYNGLDRALVYGAPSGKPTDQRRVLERAQGTWKRANGRTLRVAAREVTWTPTREAERTDTIVERTQLSDLLVLERHTHELAVTRDGHRLAVFATGFAQEQPDGPGPRLHDLDGGYGLVLDDAGCRAIAPSGTLITATCDRSSDSLEVTADKRSWQLFVFDDVIAPASAVEGIYTRAP
ncbi:MAG: hypothetical protein SFX73_36295 [Kofleriaceae bacterium]|nr:hypothetical protein [Kofleriaceae bacterium]